MRLPLLLCTLPLNVWDSWLMLLILRKVLHFYSECLLRVKWRCNGQLEVWIGENVLLDEILKVDFRCFLFRLIGSLMLDIQLLDCRVRNTLWCFFYQLFQGLNEFLKVLVCFLRPYNLLSRRIWTWLLWIASMRFDWWVLFNLLLLWQETCPRSNCRRLDCSLTLFD